ncbi:MAG: hypothetical protein ACPLW9_01030 [Minisyncoccales bacterium]
MFSLLGFIKRLSKKTNKLFDQLRKNRLNISLFLFIGLVFLIANLLLINNNNQIIPKKSLKEEKLALVNNNTLLPIANPNNPEPKVIKKLWVIVTAYSSTPWETWDDPYTTAAGTKVRNGIVANNYLPFGARIRLPELYGDKIFIVEDRLNPRKGYYHVDIWFPSYWQAKQFGVKKTYIEILES